MTDLQSKIKNATEGSRELSDEVLTALGWYRNGGQMTSPEGFMVERYKRPDPTRNLQDAVSLVPEGMVWAASLQRHYHGPDWRDEDGRLCSVGRVWVDVHGPIRDHHTWGCEDAATPCLALCTAIISAIKA